ncbi:MAG: hypothetical protein P8016_10215 [Sedimentisphaerales bacterium]
MMKIYYLLLPFIIIFVLIKGSGDQKESFEKYLRPELEKRGFKFIQSKKCKDSYSTEIDKIPAVSRMNKRKFGIGVMAGGYAAATESTHKIIREVRFEDNEGTEHEVLAAIEFSGFFVRRFLGISWHPDFDKIQS